MDEDPTKATILQTSRLFVRNLPFTCTDAELQAVFTPFGDVSQVSLFTYLSRGRVTVSMGSHARRCSPEAEKMTKLYRDIRLVREVADPQGKPIVEILI